MTAEQLEELLGGLVRTLTHESVGGIKATAYIEDMDTEFGTMHKTSYHWSTPGIHAVNMRRVFAEEGVIPVIQSLARRVLAAEKLAEEYEALVCAVEADDNYDVKVDIAALTAYREASK